jgi:hypothetical protein
MAQRDLRELEDPSSLIGSVIAFKYALYAAYMASSPTDRKNTSAAHLLSMPSGLPSDMSADELHDLVRQHYRDLARSGSALNNVLEERLWGTFDTIRTGVMVVDAPVFLITQTSDATQCSLNVFRKLKNARGEVFVALWRSAFISRDSRLSRMSRSSRTQVQCTQRQRLTKNSRSRILHVKTLSRVGVGVFFHNPGGRSGGGATALLPCSSLPAVSTESSRFRPSPPCVRQPTEPLLVQNPLSPRSTTALASESLPW